MFESAGMKRCSSFIRDHLKDLQGFVVPKNLRKSELRHLVLKNEDVIPPPRRVGSLFRLVHSRIDVKQPRRRIRGEVT